MQQNLSYGVNLGNWYSYFFHSMGHLSPYNSHPTVRFLIWEMHGFPHQFLIVEEYAAKLIVWGENGKLVVILFPYYWHFFPIRFPFYGTLHHMGNVCVFSLISNNTGKGSQNHPMGEILRNWFPEISYKTHCMWRTWEIGTHTFSIV